MHWEFIVGTALTVFTIVWTNGRTSGKVEAKMSGHEILDQTRFDAIASDIKELQSDVKKLLARRN